MIEISLHTGRPNSLGHPGPEARYKGYKRVVLSDGPHRDTIWFPGCTGGTARITHAVVVSKDGTRRIIDFVQAIHVENTITPGLSDRSLGYRYRPRYAITEPLDGPCDACGRSCEC